jgi:hypothetical protein
VQRKGLLRLPNRPASLKSSIFSRPVPGSTPDAFFPHHFHWRLLRTQGSALLASLPARPAHFWVARERRQPWNRSFLLVHFEATAPRAAQVVAPAPVLPGFWLFVSTSNQRHRPIPPGTYFLGFQGCAGTSMDTDLRCRLATSGEGLFQPRTGQCHCGQSDETDEVNCA